MRQTFKFLLLMRFKILSMISLLIKLISYSQNKMDVNEVCNLCKKPNDQMLMLACVHDPCVNCAASAYAEQVHLKSQNPDIYVCEVCGQQTVLDSTTINQLGSLAKSYVRMPTSAKTVPYGPKHQAVGSSTSPPKKKQAQSPKKSAYYCKVHSQEEISYYCFKCEVNICPECAIHGGHKDHEVKLIKKAIGEVKGEFIEVVSRIGTFQNEMSKYKDNFVRSIKENHERTQRQKNLVSREFQNLRNSLILKEKEILKNLEELNKENTQVLNNFLEEVNSHYEEMAKTKKIIENILRKDEVMVFEEYKTKPQLHEKTISVKKQSDEIAGEIHHLNTEFLQQELKEIQETITKFKQNLKRQPMGSSIYNKPNTGIEST